MLLLLLLLLALDGCNSFVPGYLHLVLGGADASERYVGRQAGKQAGMGKAAWLPARGPPPALASSPLRPCLPDWWCTGSCWTWCWGGLTCKKCRWEAGSKVREDKLPDHKQQAGGCLATCRPACCGYLSLWLSSVGRLSSP